MVNAFPHQLQKRTTSFGECETDGSTPPPLVSVTINPDPVVLGQTETFTVSGTLGVDITSKTQLIIFYGNPENKKIVSDTYKGPVCTGKGCPIKASSPFTVTANFTTPSTLPDPYEIVVGIVILPSTLLACASAVVVLSTFNETTAETIAYDSDKKALCKLNVLIFNLGGASFNVTHLTNEEEIYEMLRAIKEIGIVPRKAPSSLSIPWKKFLGENFLFTFIFELNINKAFNSFL
ncbi:16695_t:CDS:2 [Funneliformis mosseae]|uniref:Phosphatidylglycerol/phosphatidylinositol transfer protein n=1 Tax=Funneliformis mosseae TaxID=27381 RepID=A0A9N9GC61_FUNMO|nr:16695_t:CDS:2 [Funneliformis mosseae]